MIKRVVGISLLLWVFSATGSEYLSHELNGQVLQINTDEGLVEITALANDSFEVFYQPSGIEQLPSFAIDGVAKKTELGISEKPASLTLSAPGIRAEIDKSPLRIRYFRGDNLLLAEQQGLFVEEDKRGFSFALQENEKLLGGGERILGMDRRGHRFPLYNKAHYGYTTESNQMYFGLPAVMSSNKYVLIFDNSARGEMDLGATNTDEMRFEAVGGRTSYIVVAGDSYPSLIEHYVTVTGKQPLPPRWALGSFASRFGYRSEQEVRDTVKLYQESGFPLDAIVLDLYWFGADIKGHMGNLSWDEKTFPTPVNMISDLRKEGVKTILITEPFVLSSSKKWQDAVSSNALVKNPEGKPYQFDFYFGNTGLIDVFDNDARDWFNQTYSALFNQGVAGWWGDLGEPEVHPSDAVHSLNGMTATGDEVHNAYGHKWAEQVFQHQQHLAPNKRPFIMMRSGFVGSQRYGMIPWTGDVSRSWDGLKPQVELSLQMGLFGLGYTHSDLGGFAGGEVFDPQMYIRWLQYGIFQPVFRPHAQDNIAPEPVFHKGKTKDILRTYVELRYAMLPYNYSLAFENSLTGMPLMRPMFFEDETDLSLIDEKDQYLWGDALLVKPITQANQKEVSVKLPKGAWFNFWSDERYEGGKTITVPTDIKLLPVFARGGAIIPMTIPVLSTDNYSTKSLDLHYYADKSAEHSTATMYNDDGKNPHSIRDGAFETLTFNAERKTDESQGDSLTLTLQRNGSYKGMPSSRMISLWVHNWPQDITKVMVGEKQLPNIADKTEFLNANQGTRWDSDNKTLEIKFSWKDTTSVTVF
ncbi:Oligosaccharide 4-alpha-D-glucosyltransferase [Paraglaciecola mesophila]|uniref:Oligosaccharide 4-alpha-D-glucosyltransferase n=2 Tax=Paraglaciecola mesophila TaxID=197222 RepID=A0A857JEY1_9ALTE|nr:Oligosaccharide 4-alpha-D-glucosyltransferase [Paraglaciecola mesophila]